MKRLILVGLIVVSALLLTPFSTLAAPKGAKLLKNVPVSGAIEDGSTFNGKLTITEVGYDEVEGFWVSGELKGTRTFADGTVDRNFRDTFTQAPATLNESSAEESTFGVQAQQQDCQILVLDIGPIFLDLLGLQIDLSEIILDITAVGGAGNLLGNLLCAVAGLLDPSGFLDELIGTLTGLLELLNQINDLL
jgi:hypothetical protein